MVNPAAEAMRVPDEIRQAVEAGAEGAQGAIEMCGAACGAGSNGCGNGCDDGCCDPSRACCGTDPRSLCCPTVGGCFDFLDVTVDAILPCLELAGQIAGCCASPCAFPLVFLFPPTDGPSGGAEADAIAAADDGGWAISMLQAPLKRPCLCAGACVCWPCAQVLVRVRVLGGDMSRYSLFQVRAASAFLRSWRGHVQVLSLLGTKG
jgi:hypothetical protein